MNPARILIATPLDGTPETAHVSYAFHRAVAQLERAGAVVVPSQLMFADDLARGRSRCVWHALQRAQEWDWILWFDEDVVVRDATIVPRMIKCAEEDGHLVIGAPYPRKRIEAMFPYKPMQAQLDAGKIEVVRDCVDVEFLAFGFMLTHRKCLEKMVAHYADEWFFDSRLDGPAHETVALFRQVMTETVTLPDGRRHRDLLGEDYSFCWRWRQMGGKVQMYVGNGSPLGHVGGHVFTGEWADLGRVR